MSYQNVCIVGCSGRVGQELIRQIHAYDTAERGHLNPTRIVGLVDSRHFTIDPRGLAPESVPSLPYENASTIFAALRDQGLAGDVVFIDVTADGDRMTDFHLAVIRDTTDRLVTANKKPLVASMEIFRTLTADPRRYRYNTAVMAGAAAVPYLQEVHGLSETLISIDGAFSGTLAYVCSELERGEKPFSQIVAEAKDLGYTEPHPYEDLSGEDVARKLLILVRSAGIQAEMTDIELTGMVNAGRYGHLNPLDFLAAISAEDAAIHKAVTDARQEKKVPRYVASYRMENNTIRLSVGLGFVSQSSDLGFLQGTANKVVLCTSQRTPDITNPHVIQSPGAGLAKTAASLRADLLHLLAHPDLYQHS